MAGKSTGREILENAYKLETPADNAAYYGQFAPHYDTDFVEQMGYQYPASVAAAYHRLATSRDVPIADAGCGTGLVAAELGALQSAIDGMDISPEMLAVARQRNIYRNLSEVDLTAPLNPPAEPYGAVLSAGTFTHGHLGPQPLRGLLGIARAGALFVIGVNRAHFEGQCFRDVLDAMTAEGNIGPVQFDEVNIYSKQGHAHSGDRALLLHYRKT